MTTALLRADEWGMRWARDPHPQAMPVGEDYVHQTAGRDPVEEYPSGDDDPGDAWRALNEYAIGGKGYSAIDYSMGVHSGPSMRTTRAVLRGQYIPAATKNRNTVSKAQVLCGWFGPPDPRYPWTEAHARRPLGAELVAIAENHVDMVGWDWLHREAVILGHRDNLAYPDGQATACPGDWLYGDLPMIRIIAADLLNSDIYVPDPPEDDMTKVYIGRSDSGDHQGKLLLSLGGVIYRVVEPGADENGIKARMDADQTSFYDIKTDEPVIDSDAIPELGGAWVVQMGTQAC